VIQNSAMTSSWKIAISGVCIVAVTLASVVWWVRREKAIEWKKSFEAASETRARAEQGDPKAQSNLASMYSHGRGVPQDYREALRWYSRAADQGDAKGEDGLALMYSQGQGIAQDYSEALRWYRKAADQGYAKAEYNLGNMYYYGRGLPQDRAEAFRWYRKAADQGDAYAQRVLGLKGPGLTGWGTVRLLAMLLGCWVALNGSLSPQRSLLHRQPLMLTMAGVFGSVSIGLSLYWDFSVFPSVLAVSALHFATNMTTGITIAMLIAVFGPKRAKLVMGISGILLILHDLIVIAVIAQVDLTRFATNFTGFATTSRGFSSVNGLLIGIATPLAIFLWLETIKRKQTKTETT
jgi:hypothetical protein